MEDKHGDCIQMSLQIQIQVAVLELVAGAHTLLLS